MGSFFSKRAGDKKTPKADEEHKVIIVGNGGVGKSALTIQFIQGRFEESYDPTIEDTYQKLINVDGKAVSLNVVDTAGQEEYSAMRDSWLRSGDGFLLVFDLTDRATFDHLVRIRDRIFRTKETDHFPAVLVGNKKDCDKKRAVTKQEGEELARNFVPNGAAYVETSAKSAENVDAAFFDVVRECRKAHRGTISGGGGAKK